MQLASEDRFRLNRYLMGVAAHSQKPTGEYRCRRGVAERAHQVKHW